MEVTHVHVHVIERYTDVNLKFSFHTLNVSNETLRTEYALYNATCAVSI